MQRNHQRPSVFRAFVFGLVLAAALALLPAGAGAADTRKLQEFMGNYVGQSISLADQGLNERDLAVTIKPYGNDGFSLDWTTITRRIDGKTKQQSYSVAFEPTQRAGIFRAAQRRNMFGHFMPLDPMAGEPYLWAHLGNDTLTVQALLITEDGGYEIQTYERTLAPHGLDLKFSRVSDGKVLKTISGVLRRVKDGQVDQGK
ncbi:hypothetical protein IGS68_07080 [Skermanella sp. TT6]|uniref:Outer membrane lipoprotein carrier protein LolA n=1 Tax=Skermanella cutis TaxID=2775420 RepID=A0ABX7BD83_9PROT|nr:hypothetical protein [Skermanella sp. TT6]QQP90976.1 hypothetical protein IGS68_07080 [Skermanella sp. TT6]